MPSKSKSNITNNFLWAYWLGITQGQFCSFHFGHHSACAHRMLPQCHFGDEDGSTSHTSRGQLQVDEGQFQSRKPVLDLWGRESEAGAVFTRGAQSPSTPGWKGTEAPGIGSPWHRGTPSLGEGLGVWTFCFRGRLFFFQIWALVELKQIHLCQGMPWSFSVWQGKQSPMWF